jgi:hypothetical protein
VRPSRSRHTIPSHFHPNGPSAPPMASNHPDEAVREAPTPTTSQKACLGALFFSQTRLVKGDPPFCTGISRRRSYPAPVSSSETMPSGAFNYICLGYSVHDPAKLRSAAANLKPVGVEPE